LHSPLCTSSWHRFEVIRPLTAFPVTWREGMGDDFPAFKSLCLQPSSYIPRHYPCPAYCGCWHRIIRRHDNTAAIAACECDPPACPDFNLSIEDITPLELNRSKLARAVCSALGLAHKSAEIGLPMTSQIGSWSAAAIPAFLTIQNEPEVFRRVVCHLATHLNQPFILLAPTAVHLDAQSIPILTRVRAAFFPLDTTVTLNADGTLSPTRPPADLFAQFSNSALCTPNSALPPRPRYSLR
jgi:hypothetical protein